ncbi:alpha/beta hydrolase family protein [Pseudoxanthomonas indica]|uniref:Dipeptidyl aminopeptidase/acylaminoacyl peptidase n=1 Tax=Pseudoxanthomonas indica TaxID=428993 RepID=A0A1T5K3J7_9GAMM|nr:prolyl oligopeptidase family serine peptidase [Pseudoxanthomonas indica]SKC58150.1 Dipeptidyl aminopeptidase/acylaminoacyl peptidase [Pseudoxanthomonas indica]
MRSRMQQALCAAVWVVLSVSHAHAANNDSSASTGSERVPVEAFAKGNALSNPRLSPDGKHVAVSADLGEGNHALLIYRVEGMKQTAVLRLPRYQLPTETMWVSNKRLVLGKGRKFGGREEPYALGEIIATDVDGKNQDYIFGQERSLRTSSLEPGFGFVAGGPHQPNGHFYMRRAGSTSRSQLYDVDAEMKTARLIADIPVKDLSFVIDDKGVPRYAYGTDDNDVYLLYQANAQGKEWLPLDAGKIGGKFVPFAFNADGTRVFAYYSESGGPSQVVTATPEGQQRTVLLQDGFSSVAAVEWRSLPYQPIAASLGAGKPRWTYFEPNARDATLHEAIGNAIPGKFIRYTGHSQDGNMSLLHAYSDRDPGTWYLLDRQRSTLEAILASREGIDEARMGERRPFRFKASDGLELEAILTVPAGVETPRNLPMVLLPHGGPHVWGDAWAYDNDAQFLASRGYLVLQVNYRGSLGRGERFETLGYRQWGKRVQQDLIDGVRWTIAQGQADPARICSYGASFGAYSAMMVVAREPGLFKCAAGLAGLYDLNMMYAKGDTRTYNYGLNYLNRTIGTDAGDLKANSPTGVASRIKVPVLIAHGEADQRTPFAQAKAMKTALESSGNAPEWMAVPKEGHGFYEDKNNIAFYRRLEAFLDRHIGAHAGQAGAAD